MRQFHSFLTPQINSFIRYRSASQKWSDNYEMNLSYFDRFCHTKYKKEKSLTQEMVDDWCRKRESESNLSRNKRTYVLKNFLEYMNSRKMAALNLPVMLKPRNSTYIPHAFTKEELKSFFYACDTIELKELTRKCLLPRLTIPTFFRLLYSSGIRTIEARLLRIEDVDLNTGVLSIVHSKGLNQHHVVLHESMLKLMRNYDRQIRNLVKDRRYFFPSLKNEHYSSCWVTSTFKKLWSSCGFDHAVPYELRHNYATTNINRWINDSDFTARFQYLSRSMGHTTLESTKHYYSLVPGLAEILRGNTEESFNEIVPEVKDYE